jgi:IrrE N-terminal-like domain
MKYTTKQALRVMTKQLRLKVKFVDYFPDDTHGRLIPREKRILVNARKPHYEHVFTILHEIAHYVLHVLKKNLLLMPWYLKRRWESASLAKMIRLLRRYVRFRFSTERSKEKQADLWAFMAFILVAKCAGTSSELRAFVDRHPEKFWIFYSAALAVAYGGIKTRIHNMMHTLLIQFRSLCKS